MTETETILTRRSNSKKKEDGHVAKVSKNGISDATPRQYALLRNGDQLLPNNETINWYHRGILNQLDKVGSCYLEWLDHPKIGRIRMFDSNILEGFSMTYWWTVPLIYIPWGLLELRVCYRYFTDIEFNNGNIISDPLSSLLSSILTTLLYPLYDSNDIIISMPLISSVIYYMFGLLIWTLFEYICHRFLFHLDPPSQEWNRIHFMGHGLHHLTPADDLRLVFPTAISFTIGIIFHVLFIRILFPIAVGNAIFGGFGLGYAGYESVHYLSHHCPFGNYLQARFHYHSQHHFNPRKKDKLYGVTSQLWDVVFGTF